MVDRKETDVVSDALSIIGAIAAGEGADASDYALARRELNRMVAEWQTMGMHLWTRKQGILVYQPDQVKYVSGVDRIVDSSLFNETVTTADASSGASSITVSSVTGFSATNNIGIKLDDGTVQWTTIFSISSPTVNLNDNLNGHAASGAHVYVYATSLVKPLRVPSMRRFEYSTGITGSEIEMIPLSNSDYFALPNKNDSGTPVQYHFNPDISSGAFYMWPAPSSDDTIAKFTYYAQLTETNSTADNVDFPDEWVSALVSNLAVRLQLHFPGLVDGTHAALMRARAESSLTAAMDWDQGDESIYFEFSPMRWP